MKENAITFETLCARLERAIHADVGMHGLNILLYGWMKKYGIITYAHMSMRRKRDGSCWLSLGEAVHFSRYAGYDLTCD